MSTPRLCPLVIAESRTLLRPRAVCAPVCGFRLPGFRRPSPRSDRTHRRNQCVSGACPPVAFPPGGLSPSPRSRFVRLHPSARTSVRAPSIVHCAPLLPALRPRTARAQLLEEERPDSRARPRSPVFAPSGCPAAAGGCSQVRVLPPHIRMQLRLHACMRVVVQTRLQLRTHARAHACVTHAPERPERSADETACPCVVRMLTFSFFRLSRL